jgi:Ca-activated chloride channel family protein
MQKHTRKQGFALHVDRASYSNIRRFINSKSKPPPDAVRIEEMLNYFNFRTTSAGRTTGDSYTPIAMLTTCPWAVKKSTTVHVNLQAKKISLDKTPPANLVFLIDVSGKHGCRQPATAAERVHSNYSQKTCAPIDVPYQLSPMATEVAIRLTPTSGAE